VDIILNYVRNHKAAEDTLKLVRSYEVETYLVKADVSVYEEAGKLIDTAIKRFDRVDILVNNAGIFFTRELTELTPEDLDRMFKVNVYGVFYTVMHALPHMIERREGVIINISSIASSVRSSKCIPSPGRVAYVAAKSAVNGFTKALAGDLARYNIRVNAVALGLTKTELISNVPNLEERINEIPLERIGLPEDIAETVLFLVKNDQIAGEMIVVSGGE